MYTLLEEPDGSVLLRTHSSPERMSPDAARRLLLALEPTLTVLRERAAVGGSPAPPPVSAPERARRDAEEAAGAEPAASREG